MKIPAVKFSRDTSGFGKALRERVEEYFSETGYAKGGGFRMYFKSFLMLALYFVPWVFITFGVTGGGLWFWITNIF